MNYKFQLVISDIDNRHLAEYLMKETKRLCDDGDNIKTSYNNQEIVISNVDSLTIVDDDETTLVKYLSNIVDRYNKWKKESFPNVMLQLKEFVDNGGVIGKHTEIEEDTKFFNDAKGLLYIVDYFFTVNHTAVCTCVDTGMLKYFNMKVD